MPSSESARATRPEAQGEPDDPASHPRDPWQPARRRGSRPARWLLIALLSTAALNGLLVAGLVLSGEPAREAALAVPLRYAPRLFQYVGLDSWHAMAVAYDAHRQDPGGDLYRVLFEDGVKFQYPPSSLLVMPLMPEWLVQASKHEAEQGQLAVPVISALGGVAVLLTILCSTLCFLRLTRGSEPLRFDRDTAVVGAALFVLGVTFYPLQKGQFLGQVQVYLGLLVALALLLYTQGRRASAGVCLALCCLFKPQYGVLLIWGLLRRDARFSLGMLATGVFGLVLSLAVFGLGDHLRYLDVMRMLSRGGEVFWANQSVNGILHRFLETASPLVFSKDFGSYHPVVYAATLVTSALLLGAALWPAKKDRPGYAPAVDLGLCVIASTMASPIAWEHHYGAFFAVFAVASATLVVRERAPALARYALLFSFLLVANAFLRPELLFQNRWLGLLGAHTFWGGLTLFCVLQWLVRLAPRQTAERR